VAESAGFYVLAVLAVLLTAISKGGFGGAFGGIAVPLMALVVAAPRAAAIMVPILCLSDLFGFRAYYRKWDVAQLRIMLPGGLLGIAAGALSFGLLSERFIRLLVGAIAVLFPLYRWLGEPGARRADGPPRPSRLRGTFWSSVSGFTSFIAHAGGPPAMIYLLPQRLEKTAYVATANAFFMTMNAAKIIPYAALGQFSRANLLTSLVLAPLVPAGVWAGLWLHGRVNNTWFYRIAQLSLFGSGVQLVYQALTAPAR
jgi:uncharacterized membrane protein YfcA